MQMVKLDITLSIQGPFLTQSTSAAGYGIDAAVARDHVGNPFIAGSHIAGKLREAISEIGHIVDDTTGDVLFDRQAVDLLGMESKGATFEPLPKRLMFSDFVLQDREISDATRPRIRIDPGRGAVETGALQIMESPFDSGQEFKFRGAVRFLTSKQEEISTICRHLEAGLKYITQIGAERTVGFGRLLGVHVGQQAHPFDPVDTTAESSDTLDLMINPEGPFCLAERRVNKNLFAARVDIPGSVIAGTIARMWAALLGKNNIPVDEDFDPDRPELSRHFEKIRFTHAFPGSSCMRRPVRPPLSLVKIKGENKKNQLYDLALCEGPGLISHQAPAFDIDWKGRADVDSLFGWPELPRELRVRTKIDPDRRRAADEQLFAYELVVPRNNGWYARIDLSEVPGEDQTAVRDQIRCLLSRGLLGLGKTKAYADVLIAAPGEIRPSLSSDTEPVGGQWIVTLQTQALLCNSDDFDEASGSTDLWDQYDKIWQELSGGTLKLVRYFARQSLAGGPYIWNRFLKTTGKNYHPILLTEPGSVFVLQADKGYEDDGIKLMRKWLASGLPLPDWAVTTYARHGKDGKHWTNCPYIPQNGYGEIAINLPVHWQKRPERF